MNLGKYTVESTGPKIEAFLGSILKNGGFDLEFVIGDGRRLHPDFENPDVVVRFSGEDVPLLLANKAELLLSMEQLTMEMLGMRPEEHSMLQFDANDYRLLRIEELRMTAVTAAEKVRKTRLPFEFSPMTSRERRIIHLALRDQTDVRSESSGVGPHRQVVIYPADMPSGPAKPPALRRGARRR